MNQDLFSLSTYFDFFLDKPLSVSHGYILMWIFWTMAYLKDRFEDRDRPSISWWLVKPLFRISLIQTALAKIFGNQVHSVWRNIQNSCVPEHEK